jgi:microcystin degradation protein MlrC
MTRLCGKALALYGSHTLYNTNMKIAIGRIYHETNTFNPNLTTLDALKQYGYYEGDAMLEKEVISSEVLGAVESARENNVPLVGLVKAGGWAGGPLSQKDYEYLKCRLLDRLNKTLPVDGLYLALHGALVSEGEPDVEGSILESVRGCLGKGIPIVVSCDMHANITARMAVNADAILGYHTCPHLDSEKIGRNSIGLLRRIAEGEIEPAMYWVKVPMVTPADMHNTSSGPLKEIFDAVSEVETHPGVLCASVFAVQPWLDVPELGWTVVVVTNGRRNGGMDDCYRLAKACWEKRREFEIRKLSAADAIRRANSIEGHPVVISDGADATNSGSVGNGTHLLSEMLNQGVNGQALVPLLAPAMAQLAHSRGVGAIVEGEVGRCPENPFGTPLQIRGRVMAISNGQFTMSGHGGTNLKVNMGKTAALAIGDIIVVVSEMPGPGHDPMLFRHIGFEPMDAKIVVVKSPVGFRAAYEPFAKEIILADTEGAGSSNLKAFNFKRRPKPLYPFEDISGGDLRVRL